MYRPWFIGNFILIGTHAFKLEERKTMILEWNISTPRMYVVGPSFIHVGNY